MSRIPRYLMVFLAITHVACIPEAETIDPSTIVEWQNFTTTDGLAGNQVNAIVSDSEGNLWIGTNNGASKFDGTNFINFRTSNGLVNNYVTSIIEFEPGVMVFGTSGGLSILDNGSWYSIPDFGGTSYSVISMGLDSDGWGWVGTDVFGLLLTDGESFYQDWDYQCNDCNYVNYIYLDSKDVIWFGTAGGIKKLQGGTYTRYTTSNGLPDNWVQSILEDNWGTLWVGTYNGLCKQTGSTFSEESLYNSATQNWTFTIGQDSKHNLWIGAIGNGLIYSNGSSMRTNPESLNDSRKSTLASFLDKNGTLWFGTNEGGLWKYTPK